MLNTAKQDYPGSVAPYDTRPENKMGDGRILQYFQANIWLFIIISNYLSVNSLKPNEHSEFCMLSF